MLNNILHVTVFYEWTCHSDSTLFDGKHQKNPSLLSVVANADNAAMRGDPHYGGLLKCFCFIGHPVFALTNETQQHECRHFCLVCERAVPPQSGQPIRDEISLDLIPFFNVLKLPWVAIPPGFVEGCCVEIGPTISTRCATLRLR